MTNDEKRNHREDAQRDLLKALHASAETRFDLIGSMYADETREVENRLRDLIVDNGNVLSEGAA